MKRASLPDNLTPVRALRLVRKFTEREAAALARCSQSHYRAIEAGESSPTVDVAQRIADALGATVDQLWPPKQGAAA